MCVPVLSHSVMQILCSPMDCTLPGSSAHGIFQARILEWGAISYSRGSSQPRGRSCISDVSWHWQAGSLPLAPLGSSLHVQQIVKEFWLIFLKLLDTSYFPVETRWEWYISHCKKLSAQAEVQCNGILIFLSYNILYIQQEKNQEEILPRFCTQAFLNGPYVYCIRRLLII